MDTWIKLYRKFDEWEWFNVSEMVHLFIYLLINANNSDHEWHGIEVKRGQFVTGRKSLHDKTGISEQTLRTCLSRLESTKEITIKSTNRYSIITICKYNDYQPQELTPNQQSTSNQPAINQQLTTIKEVKEVKEVKEEEGGSIINFGLILENYHLYCDNLPKVAKLSDERKKHISGRFKEFGFDKIVEVLKQAGCSDFLSGKNDRCWKADIDWIFNPTNFLKIMEGKYENKINGNKPKLSFSSKNLITNDTEIQ